MTYNSSRFQDKIALITGGSSGMGLATAHRLLSESANVIITGRDKTRLDSAAAELGQSLGKAAATERILVVCGDVADPADLEVLTDTIRTSYGRLDVVFANAGAASFQPVGGVTADEFDRVVDINFKGVYFTIQQALPLLADGSAIVINASVTLHRGIPGASVYSATKAAVHNLAHTFAADLAPRRIRVNSVSPGYIETPMFRENVAATAHADIIAAVASARIGTAEDVAAAVAFLASEEASYINGQDLLIDGGLAAVPPSAML
ncbi:MAG: 3-oxoacyl-ACP reductase [Nocardia sp.]|uniref:SDR family NAD(P)-dependent oxidoreductase n=1 Tax=Nocardia sp. TaxID=1821 RepID=UPI002608B4B8|nr:SDR family oxidoreductase [Nocardia sp.]MCU1640014.1 3-oxoacyl-ACP reductase [Nocardia sp.]